MNHKSFHSHEILHVSLFKRGTKSEVGKLLRD